jgi:hypothetical protein
MKNPLPCLAETVFKGKGACERLGRVWVTSFGKKTLTVCHLTPQCFQNAKVLQVVVYRLFRNLNWEQLEMTYHFDPFLNSSFRALVTKCQGI